MEGVFLSFRPLDGDPLFVFASEGRFIEATEDKPAGIELFNGTIHSDQPGSNSYHKASFGRMLFHVPIEAAAITTASEPRGMTLPQLAEVIKETSAPNFRFYFHQRLSLAFSCLSFGLLAIPLGMSQRARGKSSAFGKMLVLFLVYYLFIGVGGMLETKAPHVMVALFWTPNVLGILLVLWIINRAEHSLTIFPSLFGKAR
jgi:lipopolysaccharide export LptBFGC system permease protein LptF